jgi:hypothetical protein
MNEYDSGKMADVLAESEWLQATSDPEQADVILFNTCSVREKAQEKVFSDLGRVKHLKRRNPGLLIGVGGCVASQEGRAIVERAPFVDLVFGPQTLHRLPALRARFAHPGAVASDQQGNIYVSDTLHHRVRVINAKSGLIQTVAGAGVPGYNGDGLPARAAWLAYPGKLQLDHKGHLYIGDYYNNRVRQVDLQSGLISTLAGNGTAGEFGDDGQASDAALINPHALWLQSEQALVIASAVSSKLRWVDLENGRIHSVPIHTEIPSTLVKSNESFIVLHATW